jgi:hypothetical protein
MIKLTRYDQIVIVAITMSITFDEHKFPFNLEGYLETKQINQLKKDIKNNHKQRNIPNLWKITREGNSHTSNVLHLSPTEYYAGDSRTTLQSDFVTNYIPSFLIYASCIRKAIIKSYKSQENDPEDTDHDKTLYTGIISFRGLYGGDEYIGIFNVTIDDYLHYTEIGEYGHVESGRFYYNEGIDEYLKEENFNEERDRYYPAKIIKLLI